MNTKYFVSTVIMAAFTLILFSVYLPQQAAAPWPVPEKYQKMKNPVPSDQESINAGKALYVKHCKSCHGTKGLGDGTKAAQLKTKCGNFSTADFQAQSDGALFYKTSEGRDDMPSFKKKIPEPTDIWAVVNYMRTLKK